MQTLVLVTPHTKNDDVKVAQQLLKKAGYLPGAIDGEFGPATAQASSQAQYWLGYANPQQSFGPVLEQLLSGQAQPNDAAKQRIAERKKAQGALGARALKEMEKFVGLVEQGGPNHVPEINGWWGGGDDAWCARTVTKAYVLAGSKAFSRGNKYQSVGMIVHDARGSANKLNVTLDPKPGDLVCYDWDGSNFATGDNHVGMFESGTPARFTTIEGNWGNKCQRVNRFPGDANQTPKDPRRIVFVHVSG